MSNTITRALTMGAATVALAGAAYAGTAIGHATEASYEQRAQSEIPYVVQQYGMPAITHMGYNVCSWEAQGYTDVSDLADSIIHYMPMSRTAAIQLQVLAEYHLGC
jgi:hypothetical protein